MVLRYCLGMIMSVSTLIILSGAATPSSVVNLSIDVSLELAKGLFLAARRAGVKSTEPPATVRPLRSDNGSDILRASAWTQVNGRRTMAMTAETIDTISVTKLHPVIGAEIGGVDLS